MLLRKEKIAIDSFLINNDILYYEYSKRVSSYRGVIIKNLSGLKVIFKTFQKFQVKTSLSVKLYLNPSRIVLFFHIDGKNKKEVFETHRNIKTLLKCDFENKDLCILENKELEKNFFLQIENFQKLSRNCKIAYGDSTFILFNQENSKKISFAIFQFTKLNFSNSNLVFFLDLLESLNIDAFLTFKFTIKTKINPILILKTSDPESIQKFTQMVQSHEIDIQLKKKNLSIRTFLNLIKNTTNHIRKIENCDLMLQSLSYFENSFINSEYIPNQTDGSILSRINESLLEKTKKILISKEIQFNQEGDGEICIPSLQSVILIQEKLNLKDFSNFLIKFYSRMRILIVILEKNCDIQKLNTKTVLFKLKKMVLLSKSELETKLIQKFYQSQIALIG
ncbi:hypothetical protein NEF87_002704 [Candidatus Lokiarchaeum ossiferum]|uniref:Uncharacterized protein n=1 Tax=Candidatus Lokiarchaeum ossiferum TaxID=2951803 RepID=A0ABY6HSD7_9ARCH|nr:hypothetical protein NEF87_002704 [Candidatus Lokiarchaeum sp. B-35]